MSMTASPIPGEIKRSEVLRAAAPSAGRERAAAKGDLWLGIWIGVSGAALLVSGLWLLLSSLL